ncbi:NO-inducible flavohemoprotein [Janthinobacterium psychrotolerans]|uniref:Flavohemoprotein n=1 Tax=Janthinobacterium psychrotolerans TaxID=1747903 RepID=A0A1A7C2E9_9BURK|nr:NO-inducible flavohemoprotein [Janthinobacterium psychrotolerans]OBV38895.1 nitric oxide dioxygenase [Janthinobacterium psychrotolerans]
MLTQPQRDIVSATVPILEQGGEALTRHFYQGLFRDYPEVLPYFNQAHQHSGEQQRALANGVLAYARNIDRLDALGGLVATIVNKHVALQIRAEHYPLVGASLLKAIREVLGEEVATDAVIDAWGAAYGQLAEILAGEEGRIYRQQASAPGGWSGARDFQVVGKVAESEEITSFLMAPVDGKAVLAFAPGQYIGVVVNVDGVPMRRQYSLSAASNGQTYRISVKREPGGKVSNYLHDQVHLDGVVQLTPPSGQFVLADGDKPLVLISGGVGITPTLAMLTQALRGKRPVHFIHAARNHGVHAFRAQIDALAARHPQLKRHYCYAEHGGPEHAPDAVGLLGKAQLAQWLPASRDVDAYFLGPQPFMRAVKGYLRELGVPENQTHHEFFGPASALN